MRNAQFQVDSEEKMVGMGQALARCLLPGERILMQGELGAGKTTLVRGIARGLGFEGRVTSPTFTIMNIYPAAMPVYHLDFYRLHGQEKLDQEWEESFYGDGVTMIEWPFAGEHGLDDILIEIEIIDNDYDLPRRLSLCVPDSRGIILEELQAYVDSEH